MFKLTSLFKGAIGNMTFDAFRITRMQTFDRIRFSRDSYDAESLKEYVQLFAIVQSVVIILSGISQTYFIRRLFENGLYSTVKNNKPMA